MPTLTIREPLFEEEYNQARFVLKKMSWYKKHGYTDTGKTKPFPENDPRFGIPKRKLEFMILQKGLNAAQEEKH